MQPIENHSNPTLRLGWVSWTLLGLLLALGAYARTSEYLFARSLWLDEAKIARLILGQSYYELLLPLQDLQAAPPGYLWITKLSTQIFGPGEKALRLPPFIASILSLPLCFAMARKFLGARFAILALLVIVLSPYAIEYASEVKQYGFDLFATLIVLYAVALYLENPESPRGVRALAYIGSATLFFSHPSAIVTAGAGIALLIHALASRSRLRVVSVAQAGSFVLFAGVANYLLFLRPLLQNQRLVSSHANSFPQVMGGGGSDLAAMKAALFYALNELLGFSFVPLVIFVFALGMVWLAVRGLPVLAGVIGLPMAILLFAVLQDRYSFFPKYLLFSVPLLALGMAAGVEGLLCSPRRWLQFIGGVLGILLFGQMAYLGVTDSDFSEPGTKEELRPVLDYVAAKKRPDDVIYVYGPVAPYAYYTRFGAHRTSFLTNETIWSWDKLTERLSTGQSFRAWILFNHVRRPDLPLKRERVDYLGRIGRHLDQYVEDGASVMLFELDPNAGSVEQAPVLDSSQATR